MRKNETGPSKDISDRRGQEAIELINTKQTGELIGF